MTPHMNRRKFLGCTAAATAALNLAPRHVLGGAGFVAPNDKIHFGYIGCGTQGLREMMDMLAMPEVQITSVCDPVKDGNNYVDWSRDGMRAVISQALGKPDWRQGEPGIPGGREVAREVVETCYARQRAAERFQGCATYIDFRELLEKEKDLDAVRIMTPDHLHATVAIAAMNRGKHVLLHKPLANRVREARLVVETARRTKAATHFLPAGAGAQVRVIARWVREGAIGALRQVHNWSNRPVWPQYPTLPTEAPPIPKDFDWDLWLGPALPRPYHPHYTHAVFRGWYEFGGGPIADMGHYSLWPVFRELDLDPPIRVDSTPSHVCTVKDQVSVKIPNDYSFPAACTIRFKFAAKGDRPALDLFWYDGGIKPPAPDELDSENQELPAEGMLWVGDEGKILAGFLGENPRILPESRAREFKAQAAAAQPDRANARAARNQAWIKAIQGGDPTEGDFLLAGPISEAFNLGAISLRLGGRRLLWDAARQEITNLPGANKYLTREYRPGWELPG